MSPDVLLHAALDRLGPVTVTWKVMHGSHQEGFVIRCHYGTGGEDWFEVSSRQWDEAWESFIRQAVGRR